MNLDVGCGAHPRGDVNVDAFPEDRAQCSAEWNPREVENFVKADAHHLPFLDKTFQNTFCDNSLEHFIKPYDAIMEILRVTKNQVEIWLPMFEGNENLRIGATSTHFYSWQSSTLRNFIGLFSVPFSIEDHLERGAGQFKVTLNLKK